MKKFFWVLAILLSLSAQANLDGQDWIFHHGGRDYRFKWNSLSRGTPLIPLEELAKKFDLKLRYDPKSFEVLLTHPTNGSTVRFFTYDRKVEGRLKSTSTIQGFTAQLSKSPQFEGLKLFVPLDFGDRALRPLLTGIAPTNPLTRPVSHADVVIDPGHGGNDYGTEAQENGVSLREKDLTLSLAWDLRRALERKKVRVALTREDDSFLTLPERTHFANRQSAHVFISLHLNSGGTKGHGYEVYVLSLTQSDERARTAVAAENQMIPEDLSEGVDRALAELRAEANLEQSLAWAKKISESLQETSFQPTVKPVKSGPFYVLYGAEMPALLVELAYLSNKEDRARLMSKPQRTVAVQKLADMIFQKLNPTPPAAKTAKPST